MKTFVSTLLLVFSIENKQFVSKRTTSLEKKHIYMSCFGVKGLLFLEVKLY